MQDIADCARAAMEENGLQPDDICAIPVGFDGIVDTESGIIYYPIHNSGWGRNIPAQEMLERRIPWSQNIARHGPDPRLDDGQTALSLGNQMCIRDSSCGG